ncbi:Alpha/beta hydrolase family-domain-containing protein [Mycena albidolilacea]|uniref:Alpha/beta hydrolase family-domain-containing protein n=1 Tax=Mycena albidolilacea TaxID=1033008 RepID=A0AAD7EBE6_9AGAR|nr:Alpha/beta hydrolase family-domain-containing protein [Mycena albidolilacea]
MSIEVASVVFTCPQNDQSAPGTFLKMTTKQYTSPHYSGDARGLTLIFSHGVGGYKEQWEPLISEVFRLQHGKAPHLRIHEAWSVDRQNHGDAALLNKEELAKSRPGGVSSYEWADAIAAFTQSPRMRGKRLVGLSHSAGALAIVGSTRAMELSAIPYSAFVLIEPTLVSPQEFRGRIEKTIMGYSAATKTRRDKWPSREAAYQYLKGRYPWKVWDPKMLQTLVEHGLSETPRGEITPKCDKHQESTCYPDTFAHFDSMKQVTRVWRTVPMHIVWGTRDDELVHESARGAVSDPSQGRGAASVTRMKGGHMLLQESPDQLALTVSQILDKIPAVPEKIPALDVEVRSRL